MLETLWADQLDVKDPLFSLRQKHWDRLQKIGLPAPRSEAFQYLSPAALNRFLPKAERSSPAHPPTSGIGFAEGYFEESLSQIPAPLVALSLEGALRSYGLFLQSRMNKLLAEETDPYALLNGAFFGRGIFLYIPPKCKAALHLTQWFAQEKMASTRLHLYLGRHSELEIHHSSEGRPGLSNDLFDFVLDEGAHLQWIDRSEGHFSAFRGLLKKNSRFKAILLGAKTRTSLKIQLAEENSEAEAYGLARLAGAQESHTHALFEHIAPHTRSKQHFKSVLKEQSRYSYEGKIYVHPAAQKTEAYQLNNNLLLSDEASANAKPNLEILADDVKASHGATVGQLDEEALFYLRSRGLAKEAARDWVIEGFCQEIYALAR